MPSAPITPRQTATPLWLVVFPEFQLLDASGPAQVFATANDESAELSQGAPYALHLGSLAGGPVVSSAGLPLVTEALPAPATLAGATVLVAGGRGARKAMNDARLLAWLVRAAATAARFGSVCTGALVLAKAGLLDGRRAVTHWDAVEALRRHFPAVQVVEDAIHVRDGNCHTSAGVTAGIDLALSLVEADCGRPLALAVARRLVVFMKRPGGQRQFSTELLAQSADDSLIHQLTVWLKPRLSQEITVDAMAEAVHLSPRTLHRRLQAEANLTPARLLQRLRLETACRLLESGDAPLKQVARASGFATPYNLRRAFAGQLGISPVDYRERFG